MTTPHQFIAQYPAPWRIDGDAVCLPLYDSFTIAAEPVVVVVWPHRGVCVEIRFKDARVGELATATPDALVDVIAEKIAHMIAFHPGVINLDKIPPWARLATAHALETHLSRLQDAQTHLEWSAP